MVGYKLSIVYFIDLPNRKKDTASYNRFLHITEMTSNNFETMIIKAEDTFGILQRFRLIRGIFIRINLLKAVFKIIKIDKHNKNSLLYIFGIDPLLSLLYVIFLKPNKIKILCERNEYPVAISNNNRVKILLNKLFIYPWYFKLYDGMTVISDPLKSFYGNYCRKDAVIRVLPMCVDFRRFTDFNKPEFKQKYLFYIGSLNNEKDGIDFLIKAFISLSTSYPHIDLVIAGFTKSGVKEQEIIKIAKENNLSERVKLLRKLNRNEVPKWLMNAQINILARPNSRQAQGGFPTKLGEYLAAGKPIIVTKVGDIPKYLNEDEVFYISSENIYEELKDKIIKVLENSLLAKKIAEKGNLKAKKLFSLKVNGTIIENTINSIIG